MRVLDLFAGPGGWDQGLSDLGFSGTVVGLELDHDACRTAMDAGHLRVRTDVATYGWEPFVGWDGLIASPPCQAFSQAGRGEGRKSIDDLLEHVANCRSGWRAPPDDLCAKDVRADLTLQPLRWVDAVRPEWLALEQVPTVAPLWQAIAAVLTGWGYSVATAVLNAADYGVPQIRKRAILVASRTSPARLPEPTHFDSRRGLSLFGSRWVTMADALGWGFTERPSVTITAGSGRSGGPDPLNGGSGARHIVRTARVSGAFVERSGLPEWCHERTATTVVSSFRPDVIAGPGYRKAGDGPRQNAPGSVSLPVGDVGVLQSFPANYPWRGSRSSQYRQVGNAVPPALASAVLRPLIGEAVEVAA